jgi:hypothetical protein
MNATSRAILQTVFATDPSLTTAERSAAQRLIDGQVEALATVTGGADEWLLVTQQQAAVLLSVSRVTIWRMTNDCMRRTVEILPGTSR